MGGLTTDTLTYGPPDPDNPDTRRQATLTICANAHNADDARQILQTLGLLDHNGRPI